MVKKLIVGNWKMNPGSFEEARHLLKQAKKVAAKARNADIVVCPPFIYLCEAKKFLGNGKIRLGAQDLFWEQNGAYTGEVSATMLEEIGVRFAIIGHSERRALGEKDEEVNKKVKAALKASIVPIICVGERERDSHGYYLAAVKKQIEHAFAGVPASSIKNCIVAYEPIWAVGNSNFESATPETAVEMAIFIKKVLADSHGSKRAHDLRVLYGGSVSAKNAGDFLLEKDITGLLVGRESLSAQKFSEIAAA